MKGLLIKDFCILIRIKVTLLIYLVIGILIASGSGGVSSALGYMMVVSTMLVITTISYDYFEKGMIFLMAMPVRRSTYVLEKYVLAVLIQLVVAVVMAAVQFGFSMTQPGTSWAVFIGTGIVCMLVAMLIISVYIPIYLKFGPEKSRIAMFAVIGIFLVGTYLISKVEVLSNGLNKLTATLDAMSPGQVVGIGVLGFVLFVAVSMLISMGILKKKEF